MFFLAGAVVALVAAFLGATWTRSHDGKAAQTQGSNTLLASEDYMEIQQVYGLYTRALDPGSIRDASWLFTNDATFTLWDPYQKFAGTEQLKGFFTGVQKSQLAGVRHMTPAYVIVGTPDGGARASSYLMVVERKTEGAPVEISTFGKYEDKLVKTADGWKFKERVLRMDTFRASTDPEIASPLPGVRETDSTGSERAGPKSQ